MLSFFEAVDLFVVFTPYFALYGLFGPKDAYVYYSSTFTASGASYGFVHILVLEGAHYRGAR